MQLHEIPNNSTIIVNVTADGKEYNHIIFHHLDGMYSYCTVGDTDIPCHLNATTPLTQNDDGTYSLILDTKN